MDIHTSSTIQDKRRYLNRLQAVISSGGTLCILNFNHEFIKCRLDHFSKGCMLCTGCPKKHGNSVINWISSLL